MTQSESENDVVVRLSSAEANSLQCVDYDKKDEHRISAISKINAALTANKPPANPLGRPWEARKRPSAHGWYIHLANGVDIFAGPHGEVLTEAQARGASAWLELADALKDLGDYIVQEDPEFLVVPLGPRERAHDALHKAIYLSSDRTRTMVDNFGIIYGRKKPTTDIRNLRLVLNQIGRIADTPVPPHDTPLEVIATLKKIIELANFEDLQPTS